MNEMALNRELWTWRSAETDEGQIQVVAALNPDGSVTIRNSLDNEPVGGHPKVMETAYQALRPLGIPMEKIYMRLYESADGEDVRLLTLCGAMKEACCQLLQELQRPDTGYRSYQEMLEAGCDPTVTAAVRLHL